jgi:hypothetical protein
MHRSFAHGMEGPSDTQPDSQIYKNWTSGVYEMSDEKEDARLVLASTEEENDDVPTDGVEKMGLSQGQHSSTITSPAVIHDDEPGTQLQTDAALTSPLKFDTTALAGRKRDSQGQVLSSATRTVTTPGTALTASAFMDTSTAMSGLGNGMSLTQMFNNTQARTSPVMAPPSEDVVFQRPSPNFMTARNSSPSLPLSSPIKGPRTVPYLRSSSEPRAEYVTMKQSQERRSHGVDNDVKPLPQDSWEEPTPAERQAAVRRAREKFEREAGRSFAMVTAPSLSSPPPQKRKGRTLMSISRSSKKSSRIVRGKGRSLYDGPDDSDEAEDARSPDQSPQPMLVNGAAKRNDSLEEVSQGVITDAANPKTVSQNKVQVPRTSSHPHHDLSKPSDSMSPPAHSRPTSRSAASGSQRAVRGSQLMGSRNSVTIMDSQPEANADFESVTRPRSLLIPSSPSQHQYSINQTTLGGHTGYTSQVVSSSMPPMPPSSSSPEPGDVEGEEDPGEGEERVPSSPPALNDDDVAYDEHTYDEHLSGRETSEDVEQHSTHSDAMEIDHGVPDSEAVENPEEQELSDEPQETIVVQGDEEIPETAEEDKLPASHSQEDVSDGHIHPKDRPETSHRAAVKPRLKRHSTIPESDLMSDTQPSVFVPGAAIHEHQHSTPKSMVSESAAEGRNNSIEAFHTARESRPTFESSHLTEMIESDEESPSPKVPRIRALADIANRPRTQTSESSEIELPQLSLFEDTHDEVDGSPWNGLSPARKKPKFTYSAKKTLRSPMKNIGQVSSDPPSSPLQPIQQADKEVPSSTLEREEQGALAAANAREAVQSRPATLKSGILPKTTRSASAKKGALKPINRSLLRKSSPPTMSSGASLTAPPSTIESCAEHPDIEMPDTSAVPEQPDPSVAELPPDDTVSTINDAADRGEAPSGVRLLPNRVFASWPGKAYYPATCLHQVDATHLRIRFDDGNCYTTEPMHVRALDLRIGDQVKVDETGLKKYIYVVVGFKNKISVDHDEEFPLTDRYGYATVVLEPRQRDSLSKGQIDEQPAISVPMSRIYLIANLWKQFWDRTFDYTPSSPTLTTSREASPDGVDRRATPSFRRSLGSALFKEPTPRANSVASSVRSGNGVVFANMAFALSFTHKSPDKDMLAKLITSNGGYVLNDSFNEMFQNIDTADGAIGTDLLTLKHQHKDLRFVATIADSHSRRTKYMQALALNIPCLHHRWLTDSIHASSALPFAKYLLPAGLSKYLDPDGVLRSRSLQPYDPSADTCSFKDMLQNRDLLLRDQCVLVVEGKTKKSIDRMKPYLFLTYTLGPKTVARCADLVAAKKRLESGMWDWVFVDGGKAGVADAALFLFGQGKVGVKPLGQALAKNKKRKRGESEEVDGLVTTGVFSGDGDSGREVKVACDEFVVQSLILGALAE